MNQSSADQNLRATASSLASGNLSIAGPSTSPSPVPQTAAATIVSIRAARVEIINVIEGWPKKTPTAQALADVLRSSIAKHETLLTAMHEPDAATSAHLRNLNTTLCEVQRAVNAEARPRKRHAFKGTMVKLLGGAQPDIFPSCQTNVVNAFQSLECIRSEARRASEHVAGRVKFWGGTSSTPPPSGSDHPKTALDVVEKILEVTSGVADMIPAPAGSIVKVIGGVGLSIIKMLNDVVNNKEEAQGLAIYVDDLVGTIGRFLQNNRKQIGADTVLKLRDFESAMKSVNDQLKDFKAQGGFRKGVSHARNKDVLAGCDTQIRRSFTQLQVHLSLDTVRLLNSLGDADARRERRELLDRLGNADTGATDKANDPEDLICLEGTRIDILDKVDTWASDPSSERVLWINGVAGCGKSAIAATVASRREGQAATAIFHFARSNQSRNKRVICSLARQLAQKVACGSDALPEHLVLSSVQANPDIADAHLSTQFKHLLIDPLSKLMPDSPPVLIIIDALDEWDNTDGAAKLVNLIRQEQGKLPRSIKFILTSRKESHLSRAFGSTRTTSLVKSLALDTTSRSVVDQDIYAYLTKHLDAISSSSLELSEASWPGTGAIEKLVELSGGLFQWASTVVRYVEEGSHDIRLKDIFARPNQLGDLDALYQLVLSTLLETNKRASTPTLLQHVLGAIVVAPTPISLDTLAYLHADTLESLHDTTSAIKEILAALGSLLIVPAHPNEPIRVLHPSIIDFLSDPRRCTDTRLYADRAIQNRRMALLCMQRMLRDLKRDICGVNDPTKFNADPSVQELVSKHIPDPLRYVCRYWAEHLSASGVENWTKVEVSLRLLCTGHLLFWFEVVGLTGMIQPAVAAIKQAQGWLSACPLSSAESSLRVLLQDARRFLLAYSEPISVNAAHIYLSALLTAPTETGFMRAYRTHVGKGPRVLAGPIARHWPGSLWVGDRHAEYVLCVAFSPDGMTVVSGSTDYTMRLWDVETGVQKGPTLEGHTSTVDCVAFSPDGRTIVSGSGDKTLRLWDVETGVQKGPTLEGHTRSIECLAFSPDGRTIVSGSGDKTLRLWDVETGVQKGPTLEGHTDVVPCLGFSPDGRTVISGSNDNTLRLWDVETGVQKGPTMEGHTKYVYCLAFSPNGKTIASGSRDATLRLWDAETGMQKGPTLEGHTNPVYRLAFSPDGGTVVSGSWDATLRLWDVETGVQKGPALEGHDNHVNCLAFLPDSKTVVSGSYDNTLRLWDVDTRLQKGSALVGHTGSVKFLAISPDGNLIASGSLDNTLRLWDVETGVQKGPTMEGHTSHISCMALSPDGRTLASGSPDRTVRLWDVETGVQMGQALEGHDSWVICLAFSPDSRMVVSGSYDSTLRLWDVTTGVQRGPALEGHTGWVNCLAFSPDGSAVASGSSDNCLRLWDVETGVQKGPTLEGHFNSITCLAFSLDGKTVASGSNDKNLRMWDAETRVQNRPMTEGHAQPINCLEFSSDGRTVASGSQDHTLRLWDVETGVQKGPTLEGHTSYVFCLAFSPDGMTVASGSADGSLRLWDAETGVQNWLALEGNTAYVNCLAFSPDGMIVASGLQDGAVRLWDTKTGVQRGPTLEGHEDGVGYLAYSPDGRALASGSFDNTLCLWDVETGVQMELLEDDTSYIPLAEDDTSWITLSEDGTSYITCLAFSCDSGTLASGSKDKTLRLWDVETGVQKGPPLVLLFVPARLEFSPNGGRIAATDKTGVTSEWDLYTSTILSPDQRLSELRSTYRKVSIRIGNDGWVRDGSRRWFWLPATFGRDVFEVSEVIYLIN